MAEEKYIDKPLEMIIADDVSNKLAIAFGRAQVILDNDNYQKQLDSETYAHLTGGMAIINTALTDAAQLMKKLNAAYKLREQGLEPVEASELGTEKTKYYIVHVDDEHIIRELVYTSLMNLSNTIPQIPGTFGHNNQSISYKLVSYPSVEEALKGILTLGDTELLITDREMPNQTGLDLLDALSQLDNKQLRKPEYLHIKNTAMLTGGISKEEADRITKTYGTSILRKPFKIFELEQQIYDIINQKQTPQS